MSGLSRIRRTRAGLTPNYSVRPHWERATRPPRPITQHPPWRCSGIAITRQEPASAGLSGEGLYCAPRDTPAVAETLTCDRCGKPIRPEDVEYMLSTRWSQSQSTAGASSRGTPRWSSPKTSSKRLRPPTRAVVGGIVGGPLPTRDSAPERSRAQTPKKSLHKSNFWSHGCRTRTLRTSMALLSGRQDLNLWPQCPVTRRRDAELRTIRAERGRSRHWSSWDRALRRAARCRSSAALTASSSSPGQLDEEDVRALPPR